MFESAKTDPATSDIAPVMHPGYKVFCLLLAVVVVALDQWTKTLATMHLFYAQPMEILPVFDFTLHHNAGAAFSFLSDAGGWQRWFFTLLSGLVSAVLIIWILRAREGNKLLVIALAFILGGAVGNVWDRATLGYVIDFISVHWHDSYFPTFNLADSAITLGAGLLILDMFINPEKHKAKYEDKQQDKH